MKGVSFASRAQETINRYIDAYQEGFFNFCRGGGLWCEDILVEMYKKGAIELRNEITFAIYGNLREDTVFGVSMYKHYYRKYIKIRKKLIIVYYKEFIDHRRVEAIGINKDPYIR